jgi:hypothetical protein
MNAFEDSYKSIRNPQHAVLSDRGNAVKTICRTKEFDPQFQESDPGLAAPASQRPDWNNVGRISGRKPTSQD